MMDVYEAVGSRRAVRAFTDRPVPREALCRVLSEGHLGLALFPKDDPCNGKPRQTMSPT